MAAPDDGAADSTHAATQSVGGLERVRRRADFLAANRGVRVVTDAFILLVNPRDNLQGAARARAGFTVSRKVGNAVARNRARRRLREMVRLALPQQAIAGADHIFIARPQERELPFDVLVADMATAMGKAKRRLARGGKA